MYYCMAPLSEDTACVDWPSPRICWYGPWPFILLIKCVLETWGDQIAKRCIYGNASEDLAVTDGSDWCHEGIKKTTLCLLHNKRGHRQLQALSGSRSEGSSCQGQDWGRNRRAILVRDSPGILVKNCKGLFLLHFTKEIKPQSNHTHNVSHASPTAALALIVHWLINHTHTHTHTHTQLL